LGPDNEHPGYTSLLRGQQHVADIVNAVQNSSAWDSTAIIVTYDENGGRWDHVSPPGRDEWGPGSRVPALIISPFAKTSYIDHTQYETLSIVKTIEELWHLQPLNQRDANATDLRNAFDFSNPPRQPHQPHAAVSLADPSHVVKTNLLSNGQGDLAFIDEPALFEQNLPAETALSSDATTWNGSQDGISSATAQLGQQTAAGWHLPARALGSTQNGMEEEVVRDALGV
jgi:phospholipase C